MLVVGLGGGVTVEQIPLNIERIDVIELEEEVVAANRWLGDRRAIDPFADPRVHVHINDARSALFLSDQKFDVIAAQASHPWTGGAAHLYTGEFFELASDHLNEQGVLVQCRPVEDDGRNPARPLRIRSCLSKYSLCRLELSSARLARFRRASCA